MPKISIIVPVYNAEEYLRKCLDSILSQTFSDWECILVDDGSKDKSGIICDEYAISDKRFKVIHKKNGGVSTARQVGTDSASGDFIIHVDSDDWIETDMLADMYEQTRDGTDIVVSDFYVERGDKLFCRRQTDVFNSDNLLYSILLGNCMGSLWNKLISVRLFKDVKFPCDLFFSEDVYVLAQILLKN